MATLRFTILGCGASHGVPRTDGDWGACDPSDPRNRRTRASAMIELFGDEGPRPTRILIDTGPDMRSQLLRAGVHYLDAVIYTHSHADHVHGIDDLRAFWMGSGEMVNVYSDDATQERLEAGFGYCFHGTARGSYPPILKRHRVVPGERFVVRGLGGALPVMPFRQAHGDTDSLGLRIQDIAYCCDVSAYPDESLPHLEGLEVFIVDALRERPHPSHFSLTDAFAWAERLRPRQTVLTHMHADLDYRAASAKCPPGVVLAHDGMAFEFAWRGSRSEPN